MSSSEDLGTAALDYVRHGWSVFPLVPGGKVPALAGHHGHKDASREFETVRGWWQQTPQANIGLPCAPNGLAVLDIDPRNGGARTLAQVEEELGVLPGTVMSITGGDGLHLLYRSPEVRLPGNLDRFGPGIDIKHNGYIVAPPSLHPSGYRYRWAGDGRYDYELPQWPAKLLSVPRSAAGQYVLGTGSVPRQRPERYAPVLLALLKAKPGERNSLLYWSACRLFETARGRGEDVRSGAFALLDAARLIGLPEAEAKTTIRSAHHETFGRAA